ncbi:MAG: TonB-dependent receptor [Saprospiraceae bacterium]|nr:TonB-dependent receptor [Saprospiraceae bacterium]
MRLLPNTLRHISLFFFLIFTSIALASTTTAYEYVVTVLDDKGQPMFGVNVFTDDQQKVATTTDENGKATLKDVDNKEVVNFTFIGFNPLKLPFYEIRRKNGIIRMSRSNTELAEIVVIGRRDDLPAQVPYTYNKIDKKDIAFFEPQTTADALWNVGGVFVQKTQMGGGSPVLRGFEANRVLLVVDGVRMNTAAYRSGHLQNAITVDNAMLERTEVIFGPGSLLYGSDALGGVVHFRSKEPKLALDDRPQVVESSLYTRFASANQEKSIHADVNYGKKNWASMTSLTYTDYNDLMSGSKRPDGYEDFGKRIYYVERVGNGDQIAENVKADGSGYKANYNLQKGSAYGQIDFTQKVKFQPNRNFYTILNFQQSTSTDVPRYDFLNELTNPADPKSFRYAEWFYGPQRRLLASAKMGMSKPTAIYDRAIVIAAFQRVHENRLQRNLHNSQRIFQLENVYCYSVTADLDKNLSQSGRSKLMYGAEFNHNDLKSESGRVKISDESTTRNALSRYPADNDMTTIAAYANYFAMTADSALSFTGGLRFTKVKLLSIYNNDSTSVWPSFYYSPGVAANNSDLTWSAGGTWRPAKGTEVKLLGSKAFRSPNIDDFSQFRPRNGFISIPNPDLKPERSYNGELAIAQQLGQNADGFRMRLSATGYYTYIKGLMTRRSHPLPDGSYIVRVDGFDYETRAMVNATYGIIKGLSFDLQARYEKHWELQSTLSFTKGGASFEVKDGNGDLVFDTLAPLDHIPPVHGFTSLSWTSDKFKFSAVARYQFAKTPDLYGVSDVKLDSNGKPVLGRSGTEDNLEYSYWSLDNGKVVYDGTLAWTTYNLYASWNITKRFALHFAVENLLDLHYRPFASGISAAGRNFITSFRVNLGK